jgi:hypothetical protein
MGARLCAPVVEEPIPREADKGSRYEEQKLLSGRHRIQRYGNEVRSDPPSITNQSTQKNWNLILPREHEVLVAAI